jgi:hypothetical protein
VSISNISVLSDAVLDLEKGKSFYESQQAGIGDYFWDCLLSDIESLVVYSGIHKKEYGYYKMLSKRFPYAIYYDISNKTNFVIAILPMKQNPILIENRLSS